MNTVLRACDQVLLSLSAQEASGIAHALNEVCNGSHIPDSEFQTRLGVTREFLLKLLQDIRTPPAASRRAPELVDAWADNGAVMVRAVTAFGDPVEMGEVEAQAFCLLLQQAISEAA